MIDLRFTVPPGVNNLFPTSRAGRRFPSAAYKAWKEANWVSTVNAGSIKGPFHITATFERRDRRRIDLDGRIKAVLDLLTARGVIEDDSLADQILLRWASPSKAPVYHKNPVVTIQIMEAS